MAPGPPMAGLMFLAIYIQSSNEKICLKLVTLSKQELFFEIGSKHMYVRNGYTVCLKQVFSFGCIYGCVITVWPYWNKTGEGGAAVLSLRVRKPSEEANWRLEATCRALFTLDSEFRLFEPRLHFNKSTNTTSSYRVLEGCGRFHACFSLMKQ